MLNRELFITIHMFDHKDPAKEVSLRKIISNYDLIKDHGRHDIVLEFMRDMLIQVDSSSANLMAEDKVVEVDYGEFKTSDGGIDHG